MGSNQSKRPHHADRGGKVWSRDERRENRKTMRDAAKRDDIRDSLDSNHVDRGLEIGIEMAADEGLNKTPTVHRKKASKKWCRRKEGQEHDPQFSRTFGSFLGLRAFHEYRCSRCGHKSYERGPRKDA